MEKVIAFDLDGTLLDSADDLMLALNTLLEEINIKKVNSKEVKNLVGNGALAMIEKAFQLNNLKCENKKFLSKRFIDIYKECFLTNSKLYPHAEIVLSKLFQNNFKLLVISNKSEYFVNKILEHFKIKNYFSAIAGGDTYSFKKPDPKHLTETIKSINLVNYKCTFVGDSINDVLCAKRTKSKLILMSYGYSKENIYDMEADEIFSDLRDILKIFKIY